MNKIQVNYVKNIETVLKQLLKMGWELRSLAIPSEVELRMDLWHPTHGHVCLARQWWDEMYPETKDQGFGLAEPYVEIRTISEEEYQHYYKLLKSMGLVDEVKDDDLTNVIGIWLKDSRTMLVNPDGYSFE